MPRKTAKKVVKKTDPTRIAAEPVNINTPISQPVPSVDQNAVLEIEKATSPDVPTVDKNAPLKIDEIEAKEENEPQEKSNKRIFILGGIGLGIIVIAAVALFIFSATQNMQEETNKEVATETVLVTPTEAPKQVLNKSEWTFEVLNGSGTAGVAKKAADQLIELGYKVIGTDNADKQTYKGNGLFVSQGMESKVDLLIADLRDAIEIATVAGILRDSTASARIIIGR
jgi:hypothetical protein